MRLSPAPKSDNIHSHWGGLYKLLRKKGLLFRLIKGIQLSTKQDNNLSGKITIIIEITWFVFPYSSLSMQATNRGSNGSQSLEKWPTT